MRSAFPPWADDRNGCAYGIGKTLLGVLALVGFKQLLVFVDVAGYDIEIETLCRLRLAIHEERKRLRARVTQPFFNGETIPPRLGDFLPLFVEEQLVDEPFRRRAAK